LRRLALSLCVAVAGCSDPAGVQPEPIGEPFRLAPGAIAWLEDDQLLVAFVGVVAESRCPEDVQCIVAGDAALELWVRRPPAERLGFTLHTDPALGDAFGYAGHTIRLLQLAPRPRVDHPVLPADYRATLLVE
jgi:hypothetical protein